MNTVEINLDDLSRICLKAIADALNEDCLAVADRGDKMTPEDEAELDRLCKAMAHFEAELFRRPAAVL